jgi:hypothetical protein
MSKSEVALEGSVNGIAVAQIDNGYEVTFDFDRHLVKMMHQIAGVTFDKDSNTWHVPSSSLDALSKTIPEMRFEAAAIAKNREAILALAKDTAIDRQSANGAGHGVVPQVSEFHRVGGFYRGEIVNANARFAAQLTGFGDQDGAAFVTIHRTADLDKPLMKGDVVGIGYDDKGMGSVSDRSKTKSAADMVNEFDSNLGKKVDGVTVSVGQDGDYLVNHDFNPNMRKRLERIDGVEFSGEDKGFRVPADKKEFLVRAVSDMREESIAAGLEANRMREVASGKMDGAKVGMASFRDGFEYSGKVIEVGERFVLQKGGMDKFNLHYLGALSTKDLDGNKIEAGQNLKVKYNKGIGMAMDLDRAKAHEKGVAR